MGDGPVMSAVFTFQYNGVRFEVVAASQRMTLAVKLLLIPSTILTNPLKENPDRAY